MLYPATAQPAWAWLRRATAPNDPFITRRSRWFSARSTTRKTTVTDRFSGVANGSLWEMPQRSTSFAFSVGHDAWHLVADPRRHLVFYGESCCSFGRKVLATYLERPPRGVALGDLSSIVTRSGVAIGDSPQRVFRLLGAPARRLTSGSSARWAVAYSRPRPPWTSSCVEERTVVFERNRVAAYEISDGC
ncbi:MAG TPA: hypothetical protein VGC96_13745 [Candidatus Elarobacter sp.]